MERNASNGPTATTRDEDSLAERAKIAKTNMPFLDDETARLAAADELHVGKINPSSRDIDDARASEARADDKNQ